MNYHILFLVALTAVASLLPGCSSQPSHIMAIDDGVTVRVYERVEPSNGESNVPETVIAMSAGRAFRYYREIVTIERVDDGYRMTAFMSDYMDEPNVESFTREKIANSTIGGGFNAWSASKKRWQSLASGGYMISGTAEGELRELWLGYREDGKSIDTTITWP